MATAWVRSLSCKSTAVADDVYSSPKPQPKKGPPPVKGSDALLPAWQSSRSTRDQLLDGLGTTKRGTSTKPETEKKMKRKPREPRQKLAASSSSSPAAAFLAMTELPEGRSSRRVVELIFASGWGSGSHAADAPEVEALFRVHATARATARFEDARRAAARAPGAEARCAADGNEMMRFQCLAADGTGEVLCAAVATCRPGSAAVRTFASSGAAHAGAGAGEEASRRRGMLVCRVVAGRVRRAEEEERHDDCDSVDNGGGELVVLDSRAVLPCFLVVYRATTNALQRSTTCR